jgi:hypothetical protein
VGAAGRWWALALILALQFLSFSLKGSDTKTNSILIRDGRRADQSSSLTCVKFRVFYWDQKVHLGVATTSSSGALYVGPCALGRTVPCFSTDESARFAPPGPFSGPSTVTPRCYAVPLPGLLTIPCFPRAPLG